MNVVAASLHFQDELRHEPRTDVEFLALVRGVDTSGRRFQEPVCVKNLSSSGLYLQLQHRVNEGDRLFVAFRFSSKLDTPVFAVATYGIVRHVTPHDDGRYGLGIKFQRHRTL